MQHNLDIPAIVVRWAIVLGCAVTYALIVWAIGHYGKGWW